MAHKAGDVVEVDGKKYLVLSAKEMLDLPARKAVIYLGSRSIYLQDLDAYVHKGAEVYRYEREADCGVSVAFSYGGDYEYYEEGEIGLEIKEDVHSAEDSLGIYRPDIETRKVGKVPMHMAIDGFPLALTHIAEIMGWAGEAKGYKLHDWRNLPNAKEAFTAAGYRHMIENAKMKAEGIDPIERTDHESGRLHIGHHVFNLLAELELILSGNIV